MSYQPPYRSTSRTSSLAVVSLVFGILAWLLVPFIGAIVAVICGHMARSEIRRAPADAMIDGKGMAVAGLVLGYIQLLLTLVGIVVVVVLLLALGMHSPF